MDSFDLRQQESVPDMSEVGLSNLEMARVDLERPPVTLERAHSNLDRPMLNHHAIDQTAKPSKTSVDPVARQSVINDDRFKDLDAGNGDVIEASWVAGVKKTLELTKNQPSLRDDEIRQIRKIYQEKRKIS